MGLQGSAPLARSLKQWAGVLLGPSKSTVTEEEIGLSSQSHPPGGIRGRTRPLVQMPFPLSQPLPRGTAGEE